MRLLRMRLLRMRLLQMRLLRMRLLRMRLLQMRLLQMRLGPCRVMIPRPPSTVNLSRTLVEQWIRRATRVLEAEMSTFHLPIRPEKQPE
jgi:hypothetical protein